MLGPILVFFFDKILVAQVAFSLRQRILLFADGLTTGLFSSIAAYGRDVVSMKPLLGSS